MKLFIASDIHGDYECTQKLCNHYERSGADRLVLLGDILYHGPRNDLPRGYSPKGVIELLNSMKNEILCVRGNCEAEVDQMVLDFPILADYAFIEANKVRMFLTHGHKYNLSSPPPLKPCDVLVHGHTHVSKAVPFGKDNLHINPGSISLPKENTYKGFVIFEDGTFNFYRLDDGEQYTSVVAPTANKDKE